MSSKAMKELVGRLESDWNFIESFLNEPIEAMKNYPITEEERESLLSRDPSHLMGLGYSSREAQIVLSGAHSQLCPADPTTNITKEKEVKEVAMSSTK